MKEKHKFAEKLRGFFLAFFILALAFLAVGLATLGSFYGTGRSYELTQKQAGDNTDPSVEFKLSKPKGKDGKEISATVKVVAVWVNAAVIYSEAGTPAVLTLTNKSSASGDYSTSTTYLRKGTLDNFFTAEEKDKNGDVVKPSQKNVVNFRYVMPFTFPDPTSSTAWSVSSRPYVRLTVSGANVLLNEIVFVGQSADENEDGGYDRYVIPATIYTASYTPDEKEEDGIRRAQALVDARPSKIPTSPQSTFFGFSDDEIYSLMTIAEMGRGGQYETDGDEVSPQPVDVYHADEVFGALGTDILALGTAIFGMSPFGLRFFPMLAAFGALVVLSRLVTKIAKSEKAGFAFALLYVLSCFTFGLGHLGTPMMIGVFFFACALSLAYRFYADGIAKADLISALPLLFSGLFAAASICVHGAFVIPVAGVVALFGLGMVRQQKAKQYRLERAAEPVTPAEGEQPEPPELRAGRVVAEYKFKNLAACCLFFAGLIVGAFLFSLIGIAPAYFVYLKLYNTAALAAPTMNLFSLAWKTFANGFVGANLYAGGSWSIFHTVFEGTASAHAVTMLAFNWVALLAGVAGLVLSVVRLVKAFRAEAKLRRAELRRSLLPLSGFVLAIVTALVGGNALGFVAFAWLFAFWAAADGFVWLEGKASRPVLTAVGVVTIALLSVVFVLLAVFTFSVPLPAAVLGAFFG